MISTFAGPKGEFSEITLGVRLALGGGGVYEVKIFISNSDSPFQ